MALRFERRHLPFRTWYHKRLPGGGVGVGEQCCLLLLSDPGTEVDDFLLLTDEGCLNLLGCGGVIECCVLLESSIGIGDVILLEYDGDGTNCIEPENC